jgi:threonine/homoserine/homoserine lactone efflux protein
MGSLLVELVPTMLGLAITPTAIVTGILFLSSRRSTANAGAFAAAFAIIYLVITVVVLAFSSSTANPLISEHSKHIGEIAIGLLLLAGGVVSLLHGRLTPTTQKKASVIDTVDSATPQKAFSMGVALAILNPNIPILLAGLAAIAAANLSSFSSFIAGLLLVIASIIGMLVPIIWFKAQPVSAKRALDRLKQWLVKHQHALNLGVFFIFGAVFTIKGLNGL